MTIWQVLGIDATVEERAIKRAYASKLKVTRPDDDPTAFQLLTDAFQHALAYARAHAGVAPVQPMETAQADEPDQARLIETVTAPRLAPAVHAPAPETNIDIVTAPRPAKAVRAPAGPSAAEQASTVWAAFIGTSTVQPRLHLKKLSDGDALLNMEVREQFELCAARYCASDACSDDLREAVVKHFRWETDVSLIARALPEETRQVMAYLRAERSWVFFQQHVSSDPAVKALMGDHPGIGWLQTCDATFMRKMRDLVDAIQEHHPEMLLLKLDQERFARWEGRVAHKRYFVQTAIYSFIAGLILALAAMFAMISLSGSAQWFGSAFLGAMAVSFGGGAWYAFKRPGANRPFRESALGARVNFMLHDVRYRPRWQFGWLLPFVAVSTLLFLPQPGSLARYVVTGSLLACVLLASFANSAVFNRMMFLIVLIACIPLGAALSEKGLAYHPVTCTLAAYCFILMLVRGGKDLLAMSPVKPAVILPLRLGWIGGAVLLGWAAHFPLALGMPAMYDAVTWLWLCAGMVLTLPSINFLYALFGAVFASLPVYRYLPTPSLLATQPFSQLFAGLTLVTIFMCVNMVRARSNQHPFT